ncbi:TIGR03668 family PPOX class F420-dependent oxidoreductase [Rhodococcus sp. AG1013]|uniref:TIGR03668 family PPOX class F420-dependent oxidoreductase n=1 Tax=unclassified Rhodococcus (in: high G+C Gram-positive bacteria) TaxID=192944 RepID=UPI000E0BD96C|nr:TIGR03668 family PPOX class F420-dependent oxidoreductase [Rhodococcus sp. AG1013]RDI26808.1 PPOX class probable F420-dependent enzyme [Rhodococcus sp. AG1013]
MPAQLPSRFTDAPIARMATVTEAGDPHVVPVVFAVLGETIYTAVDDKPKSTRRLRRLANITATGRVSLIVDHYDHDWTRLWWVRVDGAARILSGDSSEGRSAIDALVAKYPQYRSMRPAGPVVAIGDVRWRAWSAS